jgi:hypothetical protein
MKSVFDTRPRYGHTHTGPDPLFFKITYLAHGKGYVMVRKPGCIPFVITEKQWLEFELWSEQGLS